MWNGILSYWLLSPIVFLRKCGQFEREHDEKDDMQNRRQIFRKRFLLDQEGKSNKVELVTTLKNVKFFYKLCKLGLK